MVVDFVSKFVKGAFYPIIVNRLHTLSLVYGVVADRPCEAGVYKCDKNARCVDQRNGDYKCQCYPGYIMHNDTCISEYYNIKVFIYLYLKFILHTSSVTVSDLNQQYWMLTNI